ncbi:MAG: T9SS type A sorting domain-containing protein [Ferruginibacter sp.]
MKNLGILLICMLVGISAQGQIIRPIGVNLSSVTDYSTELVFTNTFKQARPWISSNANNTGAWDTQISIPLRPDGYPVEIPYNNGINLPQKVKTLLIWDLFSSTPTGTFRLKSSGTGQIRLSNGASGTYNSPVDTLVTVSNAVILELLSSDVNDPVHNIQFILPDYIDTYQSKTFTDELLKFLRNFQVIRFMDFTRTNASPVVNWGDRTKPDYYTQALNSGVAWDYVIQLANQTQKDIWINIPHQANDQYIDSLAQFLQSNLNPGLHIYLEYSNELWNSGFPQNPYAAQMAQNLGYTGMPWERTWKYTAKRSADIFKIFEDRFTNDQRLIKIIPSQAANSWLANQLVTYFNDPFYNPNQVSASAIAIAPYFGNAVADAIVSNNQVNSITVQQITDSLQSSLADAKQWMLNNKAVANTHNLTLICYEAGQHLVATGNNVNNATLTPKLIAANRHPALQNIYCEYMDFWYSNIGSLFCHYNSTQSYSKYGSWGLLDNQQDTLNPKYLAVKQCAFSYNNLGPLPVSLLAFTAHQKGKAVLLEWTTTLELNTHEFRVERSSRGNDWMELGTVGAINSPGTHAYSLVDAAPVPGINYYRLKMFDQDGRATYSPVRVVDIRLTDSPVVAPNPATANTTIFFTIPITKAELSVYDAQGRRVYQRRYAGAPVTEMRLDVLGLQSGLYVLNIRTNEQSYNERLVIR